MCTRATGRPRGVTKHVTRASHRGRRGGKQNALCARATGRGLIIRNRCRASRGRVSHIWWRDETSHVPQPLFLYLGDVFEFFCFFSPVLIKGGAYCGYISTDSVCQFSQRYLRIFSAPHCDCFPSSHCLFPEVAHSVFYAASESHQHDGQALRVMARRSAWVRRTVCCRRRGSR